MTSDDAVVVVAVVVEEVTVVVAVVFDEVTVVVSVVVFVEVVADAFVDFVDGSGASVPETSLMAFKSLSMKVSSRTVLSALESSSELSLRVVPSSLMVVGSLRLKLVVVVVLVVVVDPEVGQSGLSGHSLVSVWLPLQGSPLPTASWTTNLDRVWVPPGPQDLLHRLQRLSSDHRQSTNVLRSKQSLSFKIYRQ